jgi:Zn-dependent protease/CBS domain-containing protein
MRSGFRVARLFGINVFIDWSWIFIFLLVTWNLAAAVFPTIHPDWGFGTILAISVTASVLFFVSVLVHELAHSLVAKARGLPVRSITLFIFGGVSNIEREPPSPLTEFMVAVVGPLTSVGLGFLLLYLAQINIGTVTGAPAQFLAQLDPLTTMLIWLGSINILLGIFNMIPGFPLDGGRILRSILWAISGNLRRATRWATFVGQGIAWLFIVTGIAMVFGFQAPILGTGILPGLWLAFIGWFLNNAASQSYQQTVVQDILEGVPVSKLMRSEPPTVEPQTPISALVDNFIMGTDERAFPVLENQRLVGLVCLEDIRKVPRNEWDDTLVHQVMTPAEKLEVVSPRDDATDALRKLGTKDFRQTPVVQGNQLVGMLRRRDILRWLQLHSEKLG